MKIAVVSAGPSADKFPGRDGYDTVIAVGKIAARVACDYWVILDVAPCNSIEPLGTPRIITTKGVAKICGLVGAITDHDFEGVPHWYWSGPRALFAALKLGQASGSAFVIDAYGYDMASAARPFPADRWDRELQAFKIIAARAEKSGGKINRIL